MTRSSEPTAARFEPRFPGASIPAQRGIRFIEGSHLGDREIARVSVLGVLLNPTGIVRFLDHADRRIRRYIRAKQKLIRLLEGTEGRYTDPLGCLSARSVHRFAHRVPVQERGVH